MPIRLFNLLTYWDYNFPNSQFNKRMTTLYGWTSTPYMVNIWIDISVSWTNKCSKKSQISLNFVLQPYLNSSPLLHLNNRKVWRKVCKLCEISKWEVFKSSWFIAFSIFLWWTDLWNALFSKGMPTIEKASEKNSPLQLWREYQ